MAEDSLLWERKRLKHVACHIVVKKTPKDGEITISPENVESGTGRVLSFFSEYESDGHEFVAGDILFNKLRVYLQKVVLTSFSGISLGEMIVLRPTTNVYPNFLYWFLISSIFIDRVNSLAQGVNLPRPPVEGILNQQVLLPPLNQQRLIARYLDKKTQQIDTLIEKIEKKIELLKEQRTSLINHYVTKGLDPNVEMKDSGVEWIGKIPKHWKIYSIKRLLVEYFGGSWGDDPVEGVAIDTVSVIRVTEFDAESLTVALSVPTKRSLSLESDSKKLVKQFDLIIEKSGGGEKTPVGRAVLFDRTPEQPIVNSNFTNLLRPNLNLVDARFLTFLLFCSYVSGATVRNVKQTTGIQNLDIDGFLTEVVSVPPVNEQLTIRKRLDKKVCQLRKLIRLQQRKIKLLSDYRQSLISSVVTGKVRVTEDMV